MSIELDSHNLLIYNATHRVLICRECRYAIQKSALGSHLLRHKIYRGERQRLLDSIAQFELLEPDDVVLPPIGSTPIHHLPLISGFRCTALGCHNLCASLKRMRRHWSQFHGVRDPPDTCARPTDIQTFFRGNKIRYFQVTVKNEGVGKITAPQDGEFASPHLYATVKLTLSPYKDEKISLDLETLNYFHHFVTETSFTLPAECLEPSKYWQKAVIPKALRVHWLMWGLLAISASHLAAISDDSENMRLHTDQSMRFLQGFSIGWKRIMSGFDISSDVGQMEKECQMGAQINCILRCLYWASEFRCSVPGTGMITEEVPLQLESLTMAIQGCADPVFAFHVEATACMNDLSQENFLNVRRIFERSLEDDAIAQASIDPPPALILLIQSLPFYMSEVFGRPDTAEDFFSTVAAIKALVDCCSLSYASNDVAAVWKGMMSWLRMASDHFYQMIWRRTPAALVILAYWTLLVERAEEYCWFLKWSATKLRSEIRRELPQSAAIQDMVVFEKLV